MKYILERSTGIEVKTINISEDVAKNLAKGYQVKHPDLEENIDYFVSEVIVTQDSITFELTRKHSEEKSKIKAKAVIIIFVIAFILGALLTNYIRYYE